MFFSLILIIAPLTVFILKISEFSYKYLKPGDLQHEQLVCPLEYSCRMFTSSCFLVVTVLQSLYFQIYDSFCVSIVCVINSINYWRYPIKGFRRNFDIITALSGTIYHYYLSYEFAEGYVYRLGVILFCTWYVMALCFDKMIHNKDYSSMCHVNIHATALIFNSWLFPELGKVRIT